LVPCFANCHFVFGILAHLAAPPHTRQCLSLSDDGLKLGISMPGFWG
jgi:hypothetical protein